MTPIALVTTSILLGVFVLAGGGYGGLYGAGRLTMQRRYLIAGYACYGAQILLVAVILLVTPLAPIWKFFMAISSVIYAVVPPLTWRYLEQIHKSEREL